MSGLNSIYDQHNKCTRRVVGATGSRECCHDGTLVCVRTLGGGPNKVDEAQNKQHPAANSKVVRPILMEGLQLGWKPQREAAIFEINSYGRKRENTGFESTDHQLTVDIPPTDSWFLSNTTHTRLRQTSTARLLRRRMIGSEAIHTPCSVLSSAPLNKHRAAAVGAERALHA